MLTSETQTPNTNSARIMNELIVSLTVPGEMPSQNSYERTHWAKRAREKKRWDRKIFAALKLSGAKFAKAVEGEKRTITITVHRRRMLDEDNVGAAPAKWVVDNVKLMRRVKVGRKQMVVPSGPGLIFDDDPKHAHIVIRPGPCTVSVPRVEIEISR